MEPLFFKAENRLKDLAAIVGAPSFNGAAFFQSGKSEIIRPTGMPFLWLQWSRFFSKRKMRSEARELRLPERFNGAAFFQSGK